MGEAGVTVIIPCHNAADTIGLQLEALARQVDVPDYEVVVVDNNSSDDLGPVIDHWTPRLPSLRVVPAREHQGVSYARNVGIREARFDHIAICDADDVVSQYWLRDLWRCLADHDVVSGSAADMSAEVFTTVDEVWQRIDGQGTNYVAPPPPTANEVYPVMMGGNCAMLTAVARDLRGFDQSYRRGSDDGDFAMRLNEAGIAIAHSPVARIAYRDRATPAQTLRMGYHRGFMHTRQCARFGAWSRSPHLRGAWPLNPVRSLVAGVLMLLGAKARDWNAVASRLGTSSGLLVGWVQHRLLGRVPARQLGVGLD
ncbi:glycosyltransferase [Aestuariimicrobium ganziense]|uniref:glycosyltransferase n=1 Tax=Aestuariimicrobium ganziense TaxID=2773677 RepID=UPI001943A998|nr:glycosyltransferase family A protein [Aestuariimicrobium ganziense]